MPDIEIFIVEGAAVDALSSRPVEIGEIPTLAHKPRNNPMENTPRISISLFSRAESFEIRYSPRNDIPIQSEFDTSQAFSIGSHVKVDRVCDFGGIGFSTSEDLGEDV